jgi:phenylacetate-CoA ligase
MAMGNFYGKLLREWIFPYSHKLWGIDFMGAMTEALINQQLDSEIIRDLQFKKLKTLLHHAYSTVPYYRDKFDSLGINHEDIKTWGDFEQIPLLSKEEIQGNQDRFLSSRLRSKAVDIGTSGSTGIPLKFHQDKSSIASDLASHYRILKWWGIELGDPYIMFWGYGYNPRKAIGIRKKLKALLYKPVEDRIMNRITIAASDIAESDLQKDLVVLNKFKPKYIFAYPSGLSLLAEYIQAQDIDGRSLEIKLVLSFGEILYDHQVDLFNDVFGCPTVNGYGAGEVGAIAGSLPCGHIHTMDDFIITEVVKEKPTDEFGEIVVTHLENYASPLIRYNLQDLAIPGDGKHECPLGVGFSTLKQIIGRHHDKILLSDGTFIHGNVFSAVLRRIKHVNRFQVIQKESDCFDILVVTNSEDVMSEVEKKVKAGLRRRVGIKNFRVIRVSEIPTEATGKFRFVRSEIN